MVIDSMELETMVKKEMKRLEKTFILPDIHCPYEDYRAMEKIYDVIEKEKPKEVVIMGDWLDFYALSKFDKDPERMLSLQQEIDVVQYHLGRLREVHDGKIVYLEGNHEVRLKRYLMSHPELSSLRIMSVENLLELKDYGVQYKQIYMKNGILIKHGDVVRKHSAYTAKGEYDNEGTSGISGHTHRLSAHYITNRSGAHAWYEMGHVSDTIKCATYMGGKVPNWQQGFGVLELDKKSDNWKVTQIPIIDNSFIYNGEVYSWRANMKVPEREALE